MSELSAIVQQESTVGRRGRSVQTQHRKGGRPAGRPARRTGTDAGAGGVAHRKHRPRCGGAHRAKHWQIRFATNRRGPSPARPAGGSVNPQFLALGAARSASVRPGTIRSGLRPRRAQIHLHISGHSPIACAARRRDALRSVSEDDLRLILAANDPASGATMDFLLDNIGKRLAEGLRDDAATLPRPSAKELDTAQSRVAATIRAMADAGICNLIPRRTIQRDARPTAVYCSVSFSSIRRFCARACGRVRGVDRSVFAKAGAASRSGGNPSCRS